MVNGNSDTLSGDNYINVTGGDSSVLKRVRLDLNITNLADTLTNAQYFIDSLVTNNSFRDSVSTLINNNVVEIIRDSTTNWYTDNTTLHDSIFNTVKSRSDSLIGDTFITVTGGDSSVLKKVNLSLNLQSIADSVVKTQVFHDSIAPVRTITRALGAGIRVLIDQNVVINDSDYTIIIRKLTTDRTVQLPDATASKGRLLVINQLNAHTLDIAATDVHINFVDAGASPVNVIYADTDTGDLEYGFVAASLFGGSTGGSLKITLQSDGTRWYVISYSL